MTPETRKNISYVLMGLFGVFLVIFCCLYSRIKLGIAILKTAASYIGQVWTSVLVPVLIVIPYVVFFAVYLGGFVLVYTGEYEAGNIDYPKGYFNVKSITDNQ